MAAGSRGAEREESRDGTAPRLVVYDLDGVLVRGDSFAALLLRRAGSAPIRALRAAPLVLQWVLARDAEARASWSRRLTATMLRGMSDAEYGRLAARVGTRIGTDPRRIRTTIAQRIREQRAAGIVVVIATASEWRLVEALLASAGVGYDRLSASLLSASARASDRLQSVVFADHRVGPRKAEALLEAGVPLGSAEFVTDSATDLPTARLARATLLVGAAKRTVARFRAAGIDARVFPTD